MTKGDRSRLYTTLARAWWGGLIVLHTPILAVVLSSIVLSGPDLNRLGSALSLVLALGFFTLKYRDVAFLRLRTRQQAFVAVCLVTAVVHHGTLVSETNETAVVPAALLVATAVFAPRVLRRAGTLLLGWRSHLLAAAASRRGPAMTGQVQAVGSLPGGSWLGLAPTIPRAPPA